MSCENKNCNCHSKGILTAYSEGYDQFLGFDRDVPASSSSWNYGGDAQWSISYKYLLNITNWEEKFDFSTNSRKMFSVEKFHQVKNLSALACRLVEIEDESYSFEWYFPSRTKWVKLGLKRSYELLIENRGVIPEWFEEKIKNFKTAGNGWKVIN